jgi:hypothetical protein
MPAVTPSGQPVLAPALRHAGCAALPHACGFPDATNTGVPAGLTLRRVPGQVSHGPGWYFDPRGSVRVTGNGAVLQGLYIPYNVSVTASRVTIRDDRIVVSGDRFGVSLRHTHRVTIENTDIYSPYAGPNRLMVGIKDVYGDSTGLSVLRDDIWHTATGVQVESGLVAGCYIHAMGYRHGDHVNGITSNGGNTALLVIRGNTVFNHRHQTDAISLFEDFGIQANRIIAGNLLAGGGYTIYGGQKPGGPAEYNVHITGNLFSQLYYRRGGYYGHVAYFNRNGRNDRWAGNAWSGNATEKMAGLIP